MSDYTIVRSHRKTLAIHILSDGEIEVRAPQRLAKREIERFVASKSGWIEKTRLRVVNNRAASLREIPPPVYGKAEFAHITRSLVAEWEQRLGVETSFVGLRAMNSRWGSCTPKTGRIRINTALAYCPLECVEYVVVHELAHLRENNHSSRFWSIVAMALPDYKSRKRALKELQWILLCMGCGRQPTLVP